MTGGSNNHIYVSGYLHDEQKPSGFEYAEIRLPL